MLPSSCPAPALFSSGAAPLANGPTRPPCREETPDSSAPEDAGGFSIHLLPSALTLAIGGVAFFFSLCGIRMMVRWSSASLFHDGHATGADRLKEHGDATNAKAPGDPVRAPICAVMGGHR